MHLQRPRLLSALLHHGAKGAFNLIARTCIEETETESLLPGECLIHLERPRSVRVGRIYQPRHPYQARVRSLADLELTGSREAGHVAGCNQWLRMFNLVLLR